MQISCVHVRLRSLLESGDAQRAQYADCPVQTDLYSELAELAEKQLAAVAESHLDSAEATTWLETGIQDVSKRH